MTLPAGRLREPLDAAARPTPSSSPAMRDVPRIGIVRAARASSMRHAWLVRSASPSRRPPEARCRPARAGRRSCRQSRARARFVEDSRAAGYDVVGAIAFADHHRLRAADIARIARSRADQRRRVHRHDREGPGAAAAAPAAAVRVAWPSAPCARRAATRSCRGSRAASAARQARVRPGWSTRVDAAARREASPRARRRRSRRGDRALLPIAVLRVRHLLGLHVLRVRRRAPACRRHQPRDGVSQAHDGRAPGDRARDVRALRAPAARAAEVQHAVAASRCSRCVEFEGEERARAALRAGQGRPLLHRPLRLLGDAGDRATRSTASRSRVLARPLDNPMLHALLEQRAP